MSQKIIKHIISLSILCSILLGLILALFYPNNRFRLIEYLYAVVLVGLILIYPFMLTLLNLILLFLRKTDKQLLRKGKHIEYLTLGIGCLYMSILLPLTDIKYIDWSEALYNTQKHTPIWTHGSVTVAVLIGIGIIGYLFLSFVHVQKIPPLVSVSAIAAMYLGMAMCIIWIVQIFELEFFQLYLCLLPFNFVILGVKTVQTKVMEWKMNQPEEGKEFGNQYMNRLNQKLLKAESWPLAAFLLMWPLLGVIICILILFGQRPDSVIRAWTETSDWNLSTKAAPQNIMYDEHYLCTVAAGGHRKIVKPIRMGQRHGHQVVVNRQLCIANAFEQILEERIPVFHRHLRSFYDTYGFPVARLIHSPYIADIIYIMMKPLEWMFLIVLYFCDVNPENRIAVQYLPKHQG